MWNWCIICNKGQNRYLLSVNIAHFISPSPRSKGPHSYDHDCHVRITYLFNNFREFGKTRSYSPSDETTIPSYALEKLVEFKGCRDTGGSSPSHEYIEDDHASWQRNA